MKGRYTELAPGGFSSLRRQVRARNENEIKCPICNGQTIIRGPQTRIIWFNCAYCEGTGQVSEGRFQYWYDRQFRDRSDLFEAKQSEQATEQE